MQRLRDCGEVETPQGGATGAANPPGTISTITGSSSQGGATRLRRHRRRRRAMAPVACGVGGGRSTAPAHGGGSEGAARMVENGAAASGKVRLPQRPDRPLAGPRRVQLVREGGTRRVQSVRGAGGGLAGPSHVPRAAQGAPLTPPVATFQPRGTHAMARVSCAKVRCRAARPARGAERRALAPPPQTIGGARRAGAAGAAAIGAPGGGRGAADLVSASLHAPPSLSPAPRAPY